MIKVKAKVTGVQATALLLAAKLPKEGRKLNRATVRRFSREVRDKARTLMPRRSGRMVAETKHRLRRGTRTAAIGAIGVGPDAWYWRFPEYGTAAGVPERGFFRRAHQWGELNKRAIWGDSFKDRLAASARRRNKRGKT